MVEVTSRGPLSSLPPSSRREGGRSHIRPNLHGWESIASRLFDHHGSHSGSWKSPRRSLFKPFWRLLGMAGPFAVAGGWRRLFPILGLLLLHGGVATKQKPVSSHVPTDYHLIFSVLSFSTWGIDWFDLYLLGCRYFSSLLLNWCMQSPALENSFIWPVSCRYQRANSYQMGAEIPSFTNS